MTGRGRVRRREVFEAGKRCQAPQGRLHDQSEGKEARIIEDGSRGREKTACYRSPEPKGTEKEAFCITGCRHGNVDCAHKSYVGRERQELYKLLLTMNRDGSEPVKFGPKPMHFSWFDDKSIAGHDNQIDDGHPNDKSVRRWDRRGKFLETLAGYGNHLSFSPDREFYATESWYGDVPVVLRVYRRGETSPMLQTVVSRDRRTTWELRYHVNPSFSRDGRRVYFHHSPEPGVIEASYIRIPRDK